MERQEHSILQASLLAWFAAHARDLPWRHTRDPYRILVAEVMLQQTQVERVVPKYLAFLACFPSLAALADAPTAEVIRSWAGLGYNRRAVNLQRTAQTIMREYGGSFPQAVNELRRLPGIGPYTAGAIACFAFEQDVAFLDTNIRRVVLRCLADPSASAPSDRELLALAHTLVPAGQGWAWNQALMELGALLCTATTPTCRGCPLRNQCRDYAARRATDEELVLLMGNQAAPSRRAAERRSTYRPEGPFVGSQRWYRGRLIEALRNLPPGSSLSLSELGPQLKPDFTLSDQPWLRQLAQGLARDGLLTIEGEQVRLP